MTLFQKEHANICPFLREQSILAPAERLRLLLDCPIKHLPPLNPSEKVAATLLHTAFCGTIILWFLPDFCCKKIRRV